MIKGSLDIEKLKEVVFGGATAFVALCVLLLGILLILSIIGTFVSLVVPSVPFFVFMGMLLFFIFITRYTKLDTLGEILIFSLVVLPIAFILTFILFGIAMKFTTYEVAIGGFKAPSIYEFLALLGKQAISGLLVGLYNGLGVIIGYAVKTYVLKR